MNFDCIIIGGGISGLTCGLKCVSEGLSCAIISAGMSALHFSSGSIDLLGYGSDNRVVVSPFDDLEAFIRENPLHPYAKCGIDLIEESVIFFKQEVEKKGLTLCANGRKNHFHVTTIGTLKPTYLSQASVFNEQIKAVFSGKPKIALINVEGFRDFHPALTAANLKRNSLFKDVSLVTGSIHLPESGYNHKNPHELRSIDISRIFDTARDIDSIAVQINSIARDAKIVVMPAFMGIEHFNETLKKLSELTGLFIYEIPTLPPSILGMRLDNALKSRFIEQGGVWVAGDRVTGGAISGGLLERIHTQHHDGEGLSARFFVLSTGSFFSGGIVSDSTAMKEPVLDLSLDYTTDRKTWYAPRFFSQEGHAFLRFGVKTNDLLNPFTQKGAPISNLFCTGALLSQYDPIKEATGCGVAISTGLLAAKQILKNSAGRD